MCNNHDKEKVKASKIASSEEINHNTHRVPMEKYKETNNNNKKHWFWIRKSYSPERSFLGTEAP